MLLAAFARLSNCLDIPLGRWYRSTSESWPSTSGKLGGMVKTHWIGTMGSQALRAAMPMRAVHRLNGSRLASAGLRYSQVPPRGGWQEDPSLTRRGRACRGRGSTWERSATKGSMPLVRTTASSWFPPKLTYGIASVGVKALASQLGSQWRESMPGNTIELREPP